MDIPSEVEFGYCRHPVNHGVFFRIVVSFLAAPGRVVRYYAADSTI
jgi:hypothetical protein